MISHVYSRTEKGSELQVTELSQEDNTKRRYRDKYKSMAKQIWDEKEVN